jgi:hypothetical protein
MSGAVEADLWHGGEYGLAKPLQGRPCASSTQHFRAEKHKEVGENISDKMGRNKEGLKSSWDFLFPSHSLENFLI